MDAGRLFAEDGCRTCRLKTDWMEETKVVLGFSGGIDSAAAAVRLRSEGYDVTALTLDMTGDRALLDAACDAVRRLGLRHEVLDVRELFRREVEEYFGRSYLEGRTPAPCTRCNTRVKWPSLAAYADSVGARWFATGHYFRIRTVGGRRYVARALDARKDQSYYLWGLAPELLERVMTPMGDVLKESLPQRPGVRESMGVCFLRGRGCWAWLEEHYGRQPSGEVVGLDGCLLGRHDGVAFYTAGQRRGLSLPAGMAVVSVDAAANRLVAGPDEALWRRTLWLEACRVTDERELLTAGGDLRLVIRGVGRNPEGPLRVEKTAEGYRVGLDDGAWAPAPGQPAVFYLGDRVLGGGIIAKFD